MNKIFLTSISMLAIMSCGNGNSNNSDANEQIENDSTVTEQKQDDATASNTSDLLMDELKGAVKKVVTSSDNCDENGDTSNSYYTEKTIKAYTEEGYYDETDSEFNWRLGMPKIKRNDKNQVASVSWFVSDYGCDVIQTYTYDENGRPKSMHDSGIESEDNVSFFYDSKGNLIKTTHKGRSEGSSTKATKEYKILETDEKGNWTRRIIKGTYEYGDLDTNTTEETMTDYNLESRVITYYK